MKHIIEKWEQNIYESALWNFYFGDLNVGVLDIETTGLYPGRNKLILGCLYNVNKGELHQVLAESREEEPFALVEYLKILGDVDMVVTYNGRHFDIPFMEKRMEASANSVNFSDMAIPYDLDLYLVLSGHSPIRKLVPNMKQKTLEAYMGFWDTRTDEISGADSVELYNHYEATADPETLAKILLHNKDDVRQLTRLTKAIIKSDFHKAMNRLGFPVKCYDHLFAINKIQIGKDSICISGTQNKSPIDYMGFEFMGQPVSSVFKGNSGFELKIPVMRKQGYAIVDLEAYNLDSTGNNESEWDLTSEFGDYPDCNSGFLVVEDQEGIKYRETNHFAKAFIRRFMEEIK